MRTTKVVNRHADRFDVYIGRGSIWGNPFKITDSQSREVAVARFEEHLRASPELLARLPALHGRVLGCFCAPRLCHGHVLAHYADMLAWHGRIPEQPVAAALAEGDLIRAATRPIEQPDEAFLDENEDLF